MSGKVLSVRIDDDLYSQLKRLAEQDDRTVSNLVIKLIKIAVMQAQSTSKKESN